MPLVKLPENTILTTLWCPRCEGVGRLYRKPKEKTPAQLHGVPQAQYFYTLRCPQCGEIELWGVVASQRSSAM
jgi:phage FluMu protein Com